MGERMTSLIQKRNSWRTELFSLEESVDEEGSRTYYIDNVGIICSPYSTRKENLVELKDYLKSVLKKLESTSEEEIIYNIDKNVIEHMQ
jgi:hypothetical protein